MLVAAWPDREERARGLYVSIPALLLNISAGCKSIWRTEGELEGSIAVSLKLF